MYVECGCVVSACVECGRAHVCVCHVYGYVCKRVSVSRIQYVNEKCGSRVCQCGVCACMCVNK